MESERRLNFNLVAVQITGYLVAVTLYVILNILLHAYLSHSSRWFALYFPPLIAAGWLWGIKWGMACGFFGFFLAVGIILIDQIFFHHRPIFSGDILADLIFILFVYVAFGVMSGKMGNLHREVKKREQKLQAALVEIKKLSGIVPICAACKKIRDDEGYWHQVEAYVTAHSEAVFSHSICPECIKKLYPDYV